MVVTVGNQFHWRDLADNNNLRFNYDISASKEFIRDPPLYQKDLYA